MLTDALRPLLDRNSEVIEKRIVEWRRVDLETKRQRTIEALERFLFRLDTADRPPANARQRCARRRSRRLWYEEVEIERGPHREIAVDLLRQWRALENDGIDTARRQGRHRLGQQPELPLGVKTEEERLSLPFGLYGLGRKSSNALATRFPCDAQQSLTLGKR